MIFVVLGHGLMCVGLTAKFVFQFIYSFHMPLIFFLSGFVSSDVLKNQKFNGKIAFCQKRAIRLMVPYFSVGICYIVLDKLMGVTDLYENGLPGVLFHMLKGDNPNWQLWTLYALFGCAVISIFLVHRNVTFMIAIAIVLQIMYCTPLASLGYCTIVSSIEKYFLYFVVGLIMRKMIDEKKQTIDKCSAKRLAMFSVVLLITLNIGIFIFGEHRSLHLLTAPLGIYAVCCFSVFLQKDSSIWNKLFNLVGRYGMDIYILANLVQNLVEKILYDYANINEWIVALVSLVAGVVAPILVSKYIVRKIKILRVLILGT